MSALSSVTQTGGKKSETLFNLIAYKVCFGSILDSSFVLGEERSGGHQKKTLVTATTI